MTFLFFFLGGFRVLFRGVDIDIDIDASSWMWMTAILSILARQSERARGAAWTATHYKLGRYALRFASLRFASLRFAPAAPCVCLFVYNSAASDIRLTFTSDFTNWNPTRPDGYQ